MLLWEDSKEGAILQPFGIFAFILLGRYAAISLIILPEFSQGSHLSFWLKK